MSPADAVPTPAATAAAPRWRLPLLLLLLLGTLVWSLAPQDPPAPPQPRPRTAAPGLPVADGTGLPARSVSVAASGGAPVRKLLPQDIAAGLFGPAAPPALAPAAQVAVPAAATPASAAAAPPMPATPPAPPWQALGVLREQGSPPQALLQADGQVLVARPGERLAGGWRLESITPTHVELSREDSAQRHRLPVQPGD